MPRNLRSQDPHHPFKYYDVFAIVSVAVVMVSNIIAQKLAQIGPFTISSAILIFPITYILSDVMTEIYGYKRARRVTWMTVFCLLLMIVMFEIAIAMKPVAGWGHQEAFATILGNTPRIILASLTALLAGELVNAFVMAKMKVMTEGKHLWMRTIGSTFVGQGVDTVIFFTLAFYGVMENSAIVTAALSGWILKTSYEVLMTPVTYLVIRKLKKIEEIDFYDTQTNFNPFSLSIEEEKAHHA